MIRTPVIFWEDAQKNIHAICSNESICFGKTLVNQNTIAPEHQFDGSGIDAAAYLPEKIWAFLSPLKNPQAINTLVLDKSLAEVWHKMPWERLNWQGKKLAEFWRVIRCANVIKASHENAHFQNTLIWDQWEDDALSVLENVTRRYKRQQIQKDVENGIDIGGFRRLVIFAHGGETEDCLFKDRDEQCWNPELPKTLPPEVFIIACASYHSNFHQFAEQCLARGAKTVICGHGKLDALSMLDALPQFLNSEKPAYQMLWELQNKTDGKKLGDVNWLRSYGDAPISDFDFALFQAFQSNQFEPVFKDFKERGFSDLLVQIEKNYWQLTKQALVSCALYLAEKEDHSKLEDLRQQLKAIPVKSHQLLIESHYSLAGAFRRDGKYPLAVDALLTILKQEGIFENNKAQEIRILRSFLNDLLDLNLIIPAHKIVNEIEFLLTKFDSSRENFKFLDQQARFKIRNGQIALAVSIYQRKTHHSEDNREMAGILYALSWLGNFQQAKIYAEKIADVLLNADFHNGNDNNAYFLRALAAYKYFNSTESVLDSKYLTICKQKLVAHQDSGPFAMSLLYHGLKTGDYQHELWQDAISALEADRYWFELATFHALANQTDSAKQALAKFQQIRRDVLEKIQEWNFRGIDWLENCETIEKIEDSTLLTNSVSLENISKHGLLPL